MIAERADQIKEEKGFTAKKLISDAKKQGVTDSDAYLVFLTDNFSSVLKYDWQSRECLPKVAMDQLYVAVGNNMKMDRPEAMALVDDIISTMYIAKEYIRKITGFKDYSDF